ncbi:hypothetical protein SYK_32730 [Pseudodesulfovibrio nedwellii]|uniref:Uncharacterized protein n=1 Tax=Pseudodesulfovibrio nedwellii TaxID=2973072 RepID=A0ABN6S9N0_9BACT|nr:MULTISPECIES: hypothetical protein [Pseudodesulfovibrio]BDQ38913.1 hypothetical protein SYK_32730 [Pseudodesulfovibrio nedwellii]
MTLSPTSGKERPDKGQRLTAYQSRLRALKERSALREILEREMLLEIIALNSSAISEYPMLTAQQNSVVELLCGRIGHPGYEFIHTHIADFIVMLAHFEKAAIAGDAARAAELQRLLLNIEAVLLKCVQGIVYGLALITDNFEEIVLRYFGQQALKEYSSLIEKHELDASFWIAFVEQFIASRVAEAHKEILEGDKYEISKERTFLVIRFLFDDILSKLNPTDQIIEKTRIQTSYVASREQPEEQQRAKLIQAMLAKGLSGLSQFKQLTAGELLQAARIACIDPVSKDFVTQYQKRIAEARAQKENPGEAVRRDPEEVKLEQAQFKFLLDQLLGLGVGAAIAVGMTGEYLFKALEAFVPGQIKGIQPLKKDFSIPVLEKLLFFLLESHTIHLLKERGRDEGGKIQVRSGRARRVSAQTVDGLAGMSKIRKKKLFGNDVTREDTLLFKPKTAKQMVDSMSMLSLEPELQQALTGLWKQAVFRVDIMVLINLELVARTTTNTSAKLAEILTKYGVSKTA